VASAPIFNDAQVCRDGLEWRAATYPLVQRHGDIPRKSIDDWRGIPQTLPIYRVTVWDNATAVNFPDIGSIPASVVLGTIQPAFRLDPISIPGLPDVWPGPVFAYTVVHRFLFPRLMTPDNSPYPHGTLGVAYVGTPAAAASYPDVNYYSVADCVLIDAVPGSVDNRVDARARDGFVDVAILGTPAFSARRIERQSVRVRANNQPGGAQRRGAPVKSDVVEGLDGHAGASLMLRVRIRDIGLSCASDRLTVTARTERGSEIRPRIQGQDEITPVGCD
jgi:hypothetical protein